MWPVSHLDDLVHLDVLILSVLVTSVPGEVVNSKTVAPRSPPLAEEAENWRENDLETSHEQTTHHPADSSGRETDGGGGKTAELDPGVDNLLPRVGLPVVEEQEEAAKEITADQQRQYDSKRYRSCNNVNIKRILWQFYKLGLKVPSGRDENDGIGHFAELGSSWPGEAKTWPKIVLCVGGRAENCVLGDGRSHGRPSLNTVLFSPPARPSTHSVALFLATFWPAGTEFGKMTYTIGFVSARRNF